MARLSCEQTRLSKCAFGGFFRMAASARHSQRRVCKRLSRLFCAVQMRERLANTVYGEAFYPGTLPTLPARPAISSGAVSLGAPHRPDDLHPGTLDHQCARRRGPQVYLAVAMRALRLAPTRLPLPESAGSRTKKRCGKTKSAQIKAQIVAERTQNYIKPFARSFCIALRSW